MRSDACLVLLLASTLAGCAMERTVLDESAVDRFPAVDDELDFLDHVATLPVVTNSDALHGLLMADTGEEADLSFEARQAEATSRGWLPEDASLAPNESAEVGLIAVAICDMYGVEGGLNMALFGLSPRYCTRELIYLELIPMRTEQQSLSGLEFIDLLSRAELRLQDRRMKSVFDAESEPGVESP